MVTPLEHTHSGIKSLLKITFSASNRHTSETEFNIELYNQREDVNRQNAPQADYHFKLPHYNFNQNARFTLIEQLDNMKINKDLATLRLKKREDFWIEILKTLHANGLKC